MTDLATLAASLARLERQVGILVARLPDRGADARLGPFLRACHDFCDDGAWTCHELLLDARAGARRDLLIALDTIIGDATDPTKALGRFLQRHDDVAAGGYRLTRVKREGNVWLYAVSGES